MRKSLTGLVVALVAATTATSYAAGPSPHGGEMVLLGTRSATITVDLASPPAVKEPFFIDATTKGSFVGYLISDTKGRFVAGSVAVRGVGMSPGEGMPIAFTDRPQRPGRYVVTLLTDGVSRVAIPLAGSTRVTVRPTHPVHVFTQVLHNDAATTPAGSPLAYSSTPVPPGHHAFATVVQFFAGSADQADHTDQCFSTTPECPLGGSGGSFNFLSPGGVGDSSGYAGSSTAPADFDAGTNAVLDAGDVALNARHGGFVMVIG